MRKAPNTVLAAAFAASIGSIGCAGQQAEPGTPQAQEVSAKGCDRKGMKDISVISEEPGRIVFKICHTTYVAETRDAAKSTIDGAEKGADAPAKPDVEVKVCDTRDPRNWRTISRTPNKTVIQMCDMIQTAEIQRLQIRSSVSGPVIRSGRSPSVPVPPKTPTPSEEKGEE